MNKANINQAWFKLALVLGLVVAARAAITKAPPLARGAANQAAQKGIASIIQKIV